MKRKRLLSFFELSLLIVLVVSVYVSCADNPDLETIIAGIKYNDSLVKSGKGHCILEYPTSRQEPKVEYFYAFDGIKIRCDSHSKARPNIVQIFDGEKLMDINRSKTPFRINIYDGPVAMAAMDVLMDPRYWGLYHRNKPLGEYLEENAIKVLKKENVSKDLCYVIQAKRDRCGGLINFWIAPHKGFRCVKLQHRTSYRDPSHKNKFIPSINTTIISYQKLRGGIWFPKAAGFVALKESESKDRVICKYNIIIKDFELNVDVSNLFRFDIPPETKVYDHRINEVRTAKEALQ